MSTFPVVIGDETFSSESFAGYNYRHGVPSLLQAFNREMAKQAGLSFRVTTPPLPAIIGPLRLFVTPGLPLIPKSVLSFVSVNNAARFLLRVGSYNPENGMLIGNVGLVEATGWDTQWSVGIERNNSIESVSASGGTGLWKPEHYDLARAALGIECSTLQEVSSEFDQAGIPEGWTWQSSGAPPRFSNGTQWDGTGTYETRSYVRMSQTITTSILTSPYLYRRAGSPVTRMTIRLKVAGIPFDSAARSLMFRIADPVMMPYIGVRVSSNASSGNFVAVDASTTSLGSSYTSNYETWVLQWSASATQVFRNGVSVYTGTSLSPMMPGVVAQVQVVDVGSPSNTGIADIDYIHLSTT